METALLCRINPSPTVVLSAKLVKILITLTWSLTHTKTMKDKLLHRLTTKF